MIYWSRVSFLPHYNGAYSWQMQLKVHSDAGARFGVPWVGSGELPITLSFLFSIVKDLTFFGTSPPPHFGSLFALSSTCSNKSIIWVCEPASGIHN